MGKKKVIVSPYFQGTSSTTKDLNSQCQRQLIQNKAQLTRTPRGMALDDILKLKLPDYIVKDLDLMFVGINPGIWSAAYGHHYGNPRNHFWPCLFESGLVKQKLTCVNDADCLQFGIGFTNMVDRTTRSSSDLSKNEIREGIDGLLTKITTFKPRIVCFNGKGIYEVFSGSKCNYGLQPGNITVHGKDLECKIYVMPSTSPRTISFPRANDKLKFFVELKELRDGHKT